MKTLSLIILIPLFFINELSLDFSFNTYKHDYLENVDKEILTFDGYEGGYLFFTNGDNQAVVLELENESILKKIDLINGDYIGKKLKVLYKEKQPNDESSSIGIIELLELA